MALKTCLAETTGCRLTRCSRKTFSTFEADAAIGYSREACKNGAQLHADGKKNSNGAVFLRLRLLLQLERIGDNVIVDRLKAPRLHELAQLVVDDMKQRQNADGTAMYGRSVVDFFPCGVFDWTLKLKTLVSIPNASK
jgi:hypothetical protein